jgi:hypothetical protein
MSRVVCPQCGRVVVAERIGDGELLSGPGEPRRILAGRCPHPSCSAIVCAQARDKEPPEELLCVDEAFGAKPREMLRWGASFLFPSTVVLVLLLFPVSLVMNAYTTPWIGAGRIFVMVAACVLALPLCGILWFVWVGARDELADRRAACERARRGETESLALRPDPLSYRAY